MPIFRVKSVKIYTDQKKFTRIYSRRSWQISGMCKCILCLACMWLSLSASIWLWRIIRPIMHAASCWWWNWLVQSQNKLGYSSLCLLPSFQFHSLLKRGGFPSPCWFICDFKYPKRQFGGLFSTEGVVVRIHRRKDDCMLSDSCTFSPLLNISCRRSKHEENGKQVSENSCTGGDDAYSWQKYEHEKMKRVPPHTRKHVKNIYLGDGLGKLFWVSTSSTTGWFFYWSALKND